MDEIWIEIVDTDGRYSISNYGNVRANWSDIPQRGLKHRIKIDKIKQLQPWKHSTGYMRVALGRGVYRYVHRLVAQSFLPNPENASQVDHIDGNRTNNSVLNLRWVTAKQNAAYGGERHNWESQKIASAKRRIHDAQKQEYLALLNQGYSLRQIAKLFGTCHSTIRSVLQR